MPIYRFSGWDGTQQIMPFDADAIMEAISEDVLAHGDVQKALKKLMQQGYKFQSGEQMPGLRDLLDRLKQQRQQTLRRNNMDGIIKDIQQRLEKIKETERAGIDRRVEEARDKTQAPASPQANPESPEAQQGDQSKAGDQPGQE